MIDPIGSETHGRIRQAFLLGLSRQQLTAPAALTRLLPETYDPALAMLALAGQRQRFEGEPQLAVDPLPEAARKLHDDPRPILPPQARRALDRLGNSVEKMLAPSVMPIALRRIAAAGHRLHPFDLPALARHLKSDADNAGLAERAYLALTATDSDEDAAKGLMFDRITADNWTTFPKGQRRTFLADLRRQNPAEGRALVESVWPSELAPVRLVLLEALSVGLGPDDKPFLDKLATDRADSIKQAAALLLARMPDSAGFAEAARCFKRSGGLGGVMARLGLGAKGALSFKLPIDGMKWQEAQAERTRLFGGLPLDALAKAVGGPADDVITALASDPQVLTMLFDAALADRDVTTAQRLIAAQLLGGQRLSGHTLMQIAIKALAPLDDQTASRLLALPAWHEAVQQIAAATTPAAQKDDGRLIFTATLLPRAVLPSFVAQLSPLPPGASRAARDFCDLVQALPIEVLPIQALPT
jgi:Family of unknown function (DUF5691)